MRSWSNGTRYASRGFAAIAATTLSACIAMPPDEAPSNDEAIGSVGESLVGDNGVVANGLGANGIALNGIALNGIALNGIALNGIALNGIALNGLAFNGIAVNGVVPNGIALNGIALNGIAVNGIALNGIAPNGIALNGIALNGIALNGIALNGIALNGAQEPTIRLFAKYAAYCALASGDSITVKDFDGVTSLTYAGSQGLDPAWKTGPATLAKAGAVGACMVSKANADGTSVSTITVGASFHKVFQYMVQCALPSTASASVKDENGAPWTIQGVFGLAPEWQTSPMSTTGKMNVSSCLAARTNALGKTVSISLRGEGITAGAVEQAQYARSEGAFWADLFDANPYVKTCHVSNGLSGRTCTSGSCGFTEVGNCATVCTKDANGNFTNCQNGATPDTQVISTYLNLSSTIAFGSDEGCIVGDDALPWCTGLLNPSYTNVAPDPSWGPIDSIVAGYYAMCARRLNGTVACENLYPVAGAPVLQEVTALGADVASISSDGAGDFTAVKTDGSVWSWSAGYRAAQTSATSHPELGFDNANATWASTGVGRVTLAVKTNGTLWQSNGTTASQVTAPPNIARVQADTEGDVCVVDASATVYCNPTLGFVPFTQVAKGIALSSFSASDDGVCWRLAGTSGAGACYSYVLSSNTPATLAGAGGPASVTLAMSNQGTSADFFGLTTDHTLWDKEVTLGKVGYCGDGRCLGNESAASCASDCASSGSSANVLANGEFEGSVAPWIASSAAQWEPIWGWGLTHSYSAAGLGYAQLGGVTSSTGTLGQSFTCIPSAATSAQLTFALNVTTAETSASALDLLYIEVLGASGNVLATLATYSNTDHAKSNALTYTQRGPFSLLPQKGVPVTLRFRATNNATNATTFHIDSVKIQ